MSYDQMSIADMEVECKELDLPYSGIKSALKMLLLGSYILSHVSISGQKDV